MCWKLNKEDKDFYDMLRTYIKTQQWPPTQGSKLEAKREIKKWIFIIPFLAKMTTQK